MSEFEYQVSDDGLELTCRWTAPAEPGRTSLTLTSIFGWGDREVAEAYYEAAKRNFEQKIAQQVTLLPGERRDARVFRLSRGALYVHVNTGPPTWWLPRLGMGRHRNGDLYLRGGWLRKAIELAWRPNATD